MADWRIRTLPDSRLVEYVDCRFEPDDGTEPPGTIRVRVAFTVDGVLEERVVLLASDDLEAGR